MQTEETLAPPFRKGLFGQALIETLDEMIERGQLPAHLALKVLQRFDAEMLSGLQSVAAKAHHPLLHESQQRVTARLKGSLQSYKNLSSIWILVLKNVQVSGDGLDEPIVLPRIRLEAHSAQAASSHS
jgi:Transcription initiation factor IIA, gamma subunit, helical domain